MTITEIHLHTQSVVVSVFPGPSPKQSGQAQVTDGSQPSGGGNRQGMMLKHGHQLLALCNRLPL